MPENIDHETGEILDTPPLANGAARERLPSMPPEIAKAIIAVKGQVTSLVKDEENTSGSRKYKYTTVDSFYEAIGPLMAKAGLFLFADEVDTQIERRETTNDRGETRATNWLITKYELMLYHESGVEWGPIRRGMMVYASGPQAYGAAQSYIEKYFLRGLFKVPTGDGDADGHPQDGLPDRPQTRGATRVARPARLPNTVSSAPPPQVVSDGGRISRDGSEAPLSPRKAQWLKSLLAEESYEIEPQKAGGWPAWARLYLQLTDIADNEAQLAKLQADNSVHIKAYQTESPEQWITFNTRIAVNVKRLRADELVSPDEAAGVLMG